MFLATGHQRAPDLACDIRRCGTLCRESRARVASVTLDDRLPVLQQATVDGLDLLPIQNPELFLPNGLSFKRTGQQRVDAELLSELNVLFGRRSRLGLVRHNGETIDRGEFVHQHR